MLNWFRRQAGKIFGGEQNGRTAGSIDRCLSELAQLRQELDQKLAEGAWSVDKVVIERLQTDKVELNLRSIDVKELSGMLSIGFNYGGRLIRMDSQGGGKTAQQPLKGRNGQEDPAAQPIKVNMGMGDAQSPGHCQPGKTNQPEQARPGGPAGTSGRPQINIRFR